MGAVYDVFFYRNLLTRTISTSTSFDSASGLFDSGVGLFDGVSQDVANVTVYIRSTSDDPSVSPTWGNWNELVHSNVRGRAFQCKAVLSILTDQACLAVEELGVVPYLQQRSETSTAPTSANAITYSAAFYETSALNITPIDLLANENYIISNASSAGFGIDFRSSDLPIIKTYNYAATGYGRRI
jgi:hypothetical protein